MLYKKKSGQMDLNKMGYPFFLGAGLRLLINDPRKGVYAEIFVSSSVKLWSSKSANQRLLQKVPKGEPVRKHVQQIKECKEKLPGTQKISLFTITNA